MKGFLAVSPAALAVVAGAFVLLGALAAAEQVPSPGVTISSQAPPPTWGAPAVAATGGSEPSRFASSPPTESTGDEKAAGASHGPRYSPESVGIAALLVVLLGLLFFIMLFYSQKLEQTTFLGHLFRESLVSYEYYRTSMNHVEEWQTGEYHAKALKELPPNELGEPLRELDERFGYGVLAQQRQNDAAAFANPWTSPPNLRPGSTSLPGTGRGTSEEAPAAEDRKKYETLRSAYLAKRDDWNRQVQNKAKELYDKDLTEDRKQAQVHASQTVQGTDLGLLRGRGPQFVLEFTALVVIIFSAVVLGVLGRLSPEQIGTLLAAIAGYVLGRASAGRGSAAEAPAEKPPAGK